MVLNKQLAYAISKKYILDQYQEKGGSFSVIDGTQLRTIVRGQYRRYSTSSISEHVTLYISYREHEETRLLIPIVRLLDGSAWAFENNEWAFTREKRGRQVKPFHLHANILRCSIMRKDMLDVQA
jgi:hypothetical protein